MGWLCQRVHIKAWYGERLDWAFTILFDLSEHDVNTFLHPAGLWNRLPELALLSQVQPLALRTAIKLAISSKPESLNQTSFGHRSTHWSTSGSPVIIHFMRGKWDMFWKGQGEHDQFVWVVLYDSLRVCLQAWNGQGLRGRWWYSRKRLNRFWPVRIKIAHMQYNARQSWCSWDSGNDGAEVKGQVLLAECLHS